MKPVYAYAVDGSVLEVFRAATSRDRNQLPRIFDALAQSPFQRGDYLQRTASGRELQVKRFGQWLITYWPDHPASEIRIVRAQKLLS